MDTSACIAYHSAAEAVHPLARHLFGRIAAGDNPLRAYLSVISAAELLIRPIRAGGVELSYMHAFLRGFPNLQVLPVDMDVALETANVRALTRLPLPDAILTASALLSGCEVVVSNDQNWQRRLSRLFPQFRWIYLAQ
ncbi:MAG TPA: PIN domain-containing protein [Chloroflexota bacterium]|nr:PIN domain-containing protein [Chloroflexota bacterium]